MDAFLEKWKNDKKYRAIIKLLLYVLFIILAIIIANMSGNGSNLNYEASEKNELTNLEDNKNEEIIKLPANYEYNIIITIDEEEYQYSGKKINNEKTIKKIIKDTTTDYIYQNNNYYMKNEDEYILTNKAEVYDIINEMYINIDNINMYLNKSTKNGTQYIVYLKDIILGNNSDTYFIIQTRDKQINIDYTPLMREFNQNIKKYIVEINIEEIE